MPVRRLARLILRERANSRSAGIWSPGWRVPFSMSERMWSTTCMVRCVSGTSCFVRCTRSYPSLDLQSVDQDESSTGEAFPSPPNRFLRYEMEGCGQTLGWNSGWFPAQIGAGEGRRDGARDRLQGQSFDNRPTFALIGRNRSQTWARLRKLTVIQCWSSALRLPHRPGEEYWLRGGARGRG